MLDFRHLFRSVNARILLIVSAAVLGTIALLLCGAFYIETLMLVWNLAFVGSIIILEKHRHDSPSEAPKPSFSSDERWAKTKRDIERIDAALEKTKDMEKRRSLLVQKRFLENDLRRAEWSVRESNLDGLHNTRNGSQPRSYEKGKPMEGNQNRERSSEELDALDKYTPKGALRERRRLERLEEERKTLERIIDVAMDILKSEPRESLAAALESVAIESKAHYNLLKKSNRRRSRADYWVVWAVLSSVINGYKVDEGLEKYASDESRDKIVKLIKLTRSLNLPELSPTQCVGDGSPKDYQWERENLATGKRSVNLDQKKP